MVTTEMIEKQSEENQSLSPVTPGLQVSVGDGRRGNGGARPNAGRPKGVPNKVTQTSSCGAGRRGVRQRPADVMVSWVSNGRRISKPFSAGYCKLFIDTPVNLELGAPAGV
jgi:hypothetical protein